MSNANTTTTTIDDLTHQSANPFPVEPTGFLIGSYFACILYGVHLTQFRTYFRRYKYDSTGTRLLVLWIWVLSTLQVLIILSSGWKYFVGGLVDKGIWGEFWWPLSFQDGLIPLMAFTGQLFFGKRAWLLSGRKKWIKWIFTIMPIITLLCGIALAITARLWSNDPFVPLSDLESRPISIPSQVVAIVWMGLSAFTDGAITLILLFRFTQALTNSQTIIWRLISLTLETVLLTHIVGASMCVIFLASPPSRRTQHPLFWILLEVITELYALSVLFTINARSPAKTTFEISAGVRDDVPQVTSESGLELRQTVLDRHVEGYQGSMPFGVSLPSVGYTSSGNGLIATTTATTTGSRGDYPYPCPSTSSTIPSLLTPGVAETNDPLVVSGSLRGFDASERSLERLDETCEGEGKGDDRKR